MIKLAKLENIFWTNGSFEKPNTIPDISTFTIKENILVDWNRAKTIGTVILEGEWNYAYCEGSWYFLERVKVADRENAWHYALVKDWWVNWIDIGVIVEGFCTKTNDRQLLLDNLDYTEPLITEPCRQYRINLSETFSTNWWDNLQVIRKPLKREDEFVDYLLDKESIYGFIKDCLNAPQTSLYQAKDIGLSIVGVLEPKIFVSPWKTGVYRKLINLLDNKEDYILTKIGDGSQAGLGIQTKIKNHYVLTFKYEALGTFEEQGRVIQLDLHSLSDIVEISAIEDDLRSEWESTIQQLDWNYESLKKALDLKFSPEHGKEVYTLYPKVYLPYEQKSLVKDDSIFYHLFEKEDQVASDSDPFIITYSGATPQAIFTTDNSFHILPYANRIKNFLNYTGGRISSYSGSSIPFASQVSPPEFGFLLFQEIRERKKWNWCHYLGTISAHSELLVGLKRDWNIPTFDSYDRDVSKWIERVKKWWPDIQLFNSLYPYSWLYYFTVLKDNKLSLRSKDWGKWTGTSGWFNLKPNQEGELDFSNSTWRTLISRDVDKNYLDLNYFDKVRSAFFESKAIKQTYFRPLPILNGDIFFSELEAFWVREREASSSTPRFAYYLTPTTLNAIDNSSLPFRDHLISNPIVFYFNNYTKRYHLGLYHTYQLHHKLSDSPENIVSAILNVNGNLEEANIVNRTTEKTITYHHISQLHKSSTTHPSLIAEFNLEKTLKYFQSEEGKEVFLELNKLIELANTFKGYYSEEQRHEIGLKEFKHLDELREGELEWLFKELLKLSREDLKIYTGFRSEPFQERSNVLHFFNTLFIPTASALLGTSIVDTGGRFIVGGAPSWTKPGVGWMPTLKVAKTALTIFSGFVIWVTTFIKQIQIRTEDKAFAYELSKETDVLRIGDRYLIAPTNLKIVSTIFDYLETIKQTIANFEDLNLERSYQYSSPEQLKTQLNENNLKRDIHIALGINPKEEGTKETINNKLFDLVGTSYYLYIDNHSNAHLVFKQSSVKGSIEFQEKKIFNIPECELIEQDYIDILNQQTLLQVSTTSYPLQERLIFNKDKNFRVEISKFSFDEKTNLFDYYIVNYQGARQLIDIKLAIPKKTISRTRTDNLFQRAQLAFEQEKWREEFKYRKEIFDYQKKREFEGFQFQRERLANRTGEAAFNLAFGFIEGAIGTVSPISNLLSSSLANEVNLQTINNAKDPALGMAQGINSAYLNTQQWPYKRASALANIGSSITSPVHKLVASGMQLRELALQGRELEADIREATGVFAAQQNQFKTEHIFNERNFAMQLMNIGNVYHQGEVNDRDLIDEYNKERELNEVHLIYRVPSQMQKEALERYYELYGANCQIPSVRFEFRKGLKVGSIYAFGYIDKIINLWPTEDREALKAVLQNGFKILSLRAEEVRAPAVIIPWTTKIDELLKVATPEQKNILFKKLTTQLDRIALIKELVKQEPNTRAIIPIIEEKIDKYQLISSLFREENPKQLTNLVIKNLANIDKEQIFGLLLNEKDKGKLVENWIDKGVDLTRVLWDKYPNAVVAKNIYDSKVAELTSLLEAKKRELELLDNENRNNKAISAKTLKSLQEKIRALNTALEQIRTLTAEKARINSQLDKAQKDLVACSAIREQLQPKVAQLTKENENLKKEKDIEKAKVDQEWKQLALALSALKKPEITLPAILSPLVADGIKALQEDIKSKASKLRESESKLEQKESEITQLKATHAQELANIRQELEQTKASLAGVREIEQAEKQSHYRNFAHALKYLMDICTEEQVTLTVREDPLWLVFIKEEFKQHWTLTDRTYYSRFWVKWNRATLTFEWVMGSELYLIDYQRSSGLYDYRQSQYYYPNLFNIVGTANHFILGEGSSKTPNYVEKKNQTASLTQTLKKGTIAERRYAGTKTIIIPKNDLIFPIIYSAGGRNLLFKVYWSIKELKFKIGESKEVGDVNIKTYDEYLTFIGHEWDYANGKAIPKK